MQLLANPSVLIVKESDTSLMMAQLLYLGLLLNQLELWILNLATGTTSDDKPMGKKSDDNTCIFEGLYPEFSTFFEDVADTSMMGVIRPLYLGTKQVEEATTEVCQRGKIFHTRVRWEGQLCSLVIDTGSASSDMDNKH